MIFESEMISGAVSLSALDEMENRFEYDTLSEATMTVISEQEENWCNLMKAVGLSELSSVVEGVEVIYEGERLKSLMATIKKFFKSVIDKLGQLTKAFMDKVDQFVNKFVKGPIFKRLEKIQVPPNFEYKGYAFKNLSVPGYKFKQYSLKDFEGKNIEGIRKKFTKEAVYNELIGKATPADNNFAKAVNDHFFGEEETLKSISIMDQVAYIRNAKNTKNDAKSSYKTAVKKINEIIKILEKNVTSSMEQDAAIPTLLTYYKTFANASTVVHSTFMKALSARSRQALSICLKAKKAYAKYDKKSNKDTSTNEGYVDASAFLGAVEFI